jgi:radical SAM superfamily enzyme YgiQ (UPF0313 family)
VELVRKAWPGAPVVLGGVYATVCKDHCERTMEADHVVAGDAFPGLDRILSGLGLPASPARLDADSRPLLQPYRDAGVIRLNRGCPYSCRYCASRLVSGPFSAGDPERAFAELREIHSATGAVSFAFYDDALLVGRERVFAPFARRVIDWNRGLSFHLPNGIHLSCLDPETAALMKKAGFREIRLGFESASEDFHAEQDNKLDLDMLGGGVSILRDAGFAPEELSVYVLAGIPGQRREEVEESVRYAARHGVKVYVAEYSPVPGTPLWDQAVRVSRHGIGEEPLLHNNTFFPLEWEGFTLKDLEEVKSLAKGLRRQAGAPDG